MKNNYFKHKKTNVKRRNNKKSSKANYIDYDKLADVIVKANEKNAKKKKMENKKMMRKEIKTEKTISKYKFPILKILFLKKKDVKPFGGICELLMTFNVFVLRIIWVALYCMGISMLFFGIYQIFDLLFVFNSIVLVTGTMLIGFFIVILGSLVRIAMMELENNNNMEFQLKIFNLLVGIVLAVLSD